MRTWFFAFVLACSLFASSASAQRVTSPNTRTTQAPRPTQMARTTLLRSAVDARHATRRAWRSIRTGRPTEHRSDQFRYLVHALHPTAARSVALLEHPESIADITLLSMSLIDASAPGTYYSAGFILDVPEGNIHTAAARDIGTQNATPSPFRHLRELRRLHGLPHPDALVEGSRSASALGLYNEVVALGRARGGRSIRASAIFVKLSAATGEPAVDAAYLTRLRATATRHGLPLVEIADDFAVEIAPDATGRLARMSPGTRITTGSGSPVWLHWTSPRADAPTTSSDLSAIVLRERGRTLRWHAGRLRELRGGAEQRVSARTRAMFARSVASAAQSSPALATIVRALQLERSLR